MTATLIIIGRIVLGGIFVVFGLRNIANLERLTEVMVKKGLLPQPRLWMIAGIGIQIVGGALVATGFLAWLGALALIAFLILAVYLFHAFWEFPADERAPHVSAWLINTALSGGFLIVAALHWPGAA